MSPGNVDDRRDRLPRRTSFRELSENERRIEWFYSEIVTQDGTSTLGVRRKENETKKGP